MPASSCSRADLLKCRSATTAEAAGVQREIQETQAMKVRWHARLLYADVGVRELNLDSASIRVRMLSYFTRPITVYISGSFGVVQY